MFTCPFPTPSSLVQGDWQRSAEGYTIQSTSGQDYIEFNPAIQEEGDFSMSVEVGDCASQCGGRTGLMVRLLDGSTSIQEWPVNMAKAGSMFMVGTARMKPNYRVRVFAGTNGQSVIASLVLMHQRPIAALNGLAQFNLDTFTWSPLSNTATTMSAVELVSDQVFAGGSVAGSPINLFQRTGDHWTAISPVGLNGTVSSVKVVGDYVYVGGSFGGLLDGKVLLGVGQFDITKKEWTSLQGGLDGPVTKLSFDPITNQVLVSGSFTRAYTSLDRSTSLAAPGCALWSIGNNSWIEMSNQGAFELCLFAVQGNQTTTMLYGEMQPDYTVVSPGFHDIGAQGVVSYSFARSIQAGAWKNDQVLYSIIQGNGTSAVMVYDTRDHIWAPLGIEALDGECILH